MSFEYEDPYSLDVSQKIGVTAPSGAVVFVMTDNEKQYFLDITKRYTSDNVFSNISDLQDLDRIIVMETMIYRWSQWLLQECDYFGSEIDVEGLKKSLKEFSGELRLIKKSLGMDKTTRDKEKSASVADYIENIRLRAKEFGIKRNEEAYKAIISFHKLAAFLELHDNCTPLERKENDCEIEDIILWIREAVKEFEDIDADFREKQKVWIRTELN